jgi:CDGSH-type Zn-finger protein
MSEQSVHCEVCKKAILICSCGETEEAPFISPTDND